LASIGAKAAPAARITAMALLIVESNRDLARLWQRHIERQGWQVLLAHDQDGAIRILQGPGISLLLLNVLLAAGSAFAVADYASFRHPDIPILFVTSSRFFSDGSIFAHVANARAFVPAATPPSDLALMVDHYAARN